MACCTAADREGRPAVRANLSSTATSSAGRLTLSFILIYYGRKILVRHP